MNAPACVIGHITVKDPEKWAEYRSRVPATLAPWGAELLLRGRLDGLTLLAEENGQLVGYCKLGLDVSLDYDPEGRRVVDSLDSLLPTGWESWQPDPSWSLPILPAGWDRPAERPG